MIPSKLKPYERVRNALIRCSREKYLYPQVVMHLAKVFSRCAVFGNSHITEANAICNNYGPYGNPIQGCHVTGLLHGERPLVIGSKYGKELRREILKNRRKTSEPIELAILRLVIKEKMHGN